MLNEKEWLKINNILAELYTIENLGIMAHKLMNSFHLLVPYSKGYFIILDEHRKIITDKSHFIGITENEKKRYINYFYEKDYLNYLYEFVKETTVYRDTDIIEQTMREKTEFYTDFLRPSNITFGCGILIVYESKIVGIFNLFCNDKDFSDKDLYILHVFKRHIENITVNILKTSKIRNIHDRRIGELSKKFGLTAREEEVMHLITQGLSNDDIKEMLAISLSTVKKHINNLYRKAAVKYRTQLLALLYDELR
jgi:DNA-binding CsgD family transcriptional regulator